MASDAADPNVSNAIRSEREAAWLLAGLPLLGDIFVRDPAAVRLAPRFVNVKSCTAEVGEPRHAQGRFGCRVNRPLQHHLSFINRWMDSFVLCFWHRLDQQRERLAEACGAGRFASIVPETHHDEIVRGNHQRRLPACARHVIGIARDWISPVAVEPKESSIDRPIVRGPGGRKRADEFGIALWENALTVPDATLKKEVAKPRPIASGADLIALP